MKAKAVFYHAGCPVCVAAEDSVARAIDPVQYDVEIVHLGNDKSRIAEAESAGSNPYLPCFWMVRRFISILEPVFLN